MPETKKKQLPLPSMSEAVADHLAEHLSRLGNDAYALSRANDFLCESVADLREEVRTLREAIEDLASEMKGLAETIEEGRKSA